jgi:hypothetical protein
MDTELSLNKMFTNVWPHLGERERRLIAASEAQRLGRKGISIVSRACGLSRVTITKGIKELSDLPLEPGKTRRPGAGRPKVERLDPTMLNILDELIKDPLQLEAEQPLLWTCKSTRKLSMELTESGHKISHEKIAQILRQSGYNLSGTRQTDEKDDNFDRESQFRFLNQRISHYLVENQPVFSLESKKADLALFSQKTWPENPIIPENQGSYQLKPNNQVYELGLYDSKLNPDHLNLKTNGQAEAFALDSLYGWWIVEGMYIFPEAKKILITADCNCPRRHNQWKQKIQQLSNAIGLPIEFCRFPKGSTKWNKNSNRLFSFLSSQWAGEGQKECELTAKLINGNAQIRTLALGLRLDHSSYNLSEQLVEKQKSIFVFPSTFYGEWNYTISPVSGNIKSVFFDQPLSAFN